MNNYVEQTTWIFTYIMWSQGSQTQKSTHCMIPHLKTQTWAKLVYDVRNQDSNVFGEEVVTGGEQEKR